MRNVGTVSSEGGPLLIADVSIVRSWQGADDEDAYEHACEILTTVPKAEGKTISIANGTGLLWDMGGQGVSDVFLKSSTHIIVVRAWLEDPNDVEIVTLFANTPIQECQRLGSVTIETGIASILWAPENGEGIMPDVISGDAIHIEGLSVKGSGLLVKLEAGDYQCLHDEISNASEEARRLHLIKL